MANIEQFSRLKYVELSGGRYYPLTRSCYSSWDRFFARSLLPYLVPDSSEPRKNGDPSSRRYSGRLRLTIPHLRRYSGLLLACYSFSPAFLFFPCANNASSARFESRVRFSRGRARPLERDRYDTRTMSPSSCRTYMHRLASILLSNLIYYAAHPSSHPRP